MVGKRSAICLVISILFCLSAVSTQGAELTGRDIMIKVDERPDGDDQRSIMKMTLINKRGKTRERSVLTYSKDYGKDRKSLMYFQSPGDVKGTGFLSWDYDDPKKDDDQWLYLPALKKSRRISSSSKNDNFMGTDFTYDDMGDRNVDEDMHELLREEELDGHKCWVVESKSKEEDYIYSRRVSWVRKDALVMLKVEFYDRRGSLLKILTSPDIRKQDGIWAHFRMEMENVQNEHKTIIEMMEIQYDIGIKDSMFRVSTLERGRIK
ncbi:outer membrane lipoprotein-sorting protein [Candidatus Poribacteria bacterium]